MEVLYLGSSSTYLGSIATSMVSDVLTTPTNLTSSAASWTTTGMTNPNAQKMTCSATVQKTGPAVVRIFTAKASKTVYYDPYVTGSSGITQSRQYQVPGGSFINETSTGGGGSVAFPPVRMAA
jgi:hypothetical protein